MIEKLLRRFCEAKHRPLIVIAGTFVVGLLLILPLVDLYSAGRAEKEGLLGELESARRVAAELQRFESRVADKLAELDAFERRTVSDETLPALREKLVDIAKESECSIRRLSVGIASSRAWSPGENPIGPADARRGETKQPYLLEWRPVSVSVSGTSSSLRSMMERVSSAGMLMHTKSFEIYPSSPNRQTLTMDVELWYFTLIRRGELGQG